MVGLAFANEKSRPDLDTQKAIVESGIRFEPYDARLYSLLGTIAELEGRDAKTVQQLYIHSLALDPTDLRALLRRFAYSVSNGQVKDALKQAELIFRAWPQFWDLIEPSLPELLSSEEGFQQAYERFSTLPAGPRSMLVSLTKVEAGLAIAKRLLVEWHKKGVQDLRPAINVITSRLVQADQPFQAYLLFGLTLNSEERIEAGYIFNPHFALDPNGNLFDWSLPRVPGISAQVVNNENDGHSEKPGPRAVVSRDLEIKFLNTPVRLSSVLQTVRLPASKFNWSITYSTQQLKGPKPVEVQLRCLNKRKIIERMTLAPTDGESRRIEISLTMPASDCALQQIIIDNGNLVESWQNRYSGSISLHELQIQSSGS